LEKRTVPEVERHPSINSKVPPLVDVSHLQHYLVYCVKRNQAVLQRHLYY
jgi:hypothetical protein